MGSRNPVTGAVAPASRVCTECQMQTSMWGPDVIQRYGCENSGSRGFEAVWSDVTVSPRAALFCAPPSCGLTHGLSVNECQQHPCSVSTGYPGSQRRPCEGCHAEVPGVPTPGVCVTENQVPNGKTVRTRDT